MKYTYEIFFVDGNKSIFHTDGFELSIDFADPQALVIDVEGDETVYINKSNITTIVRHKDHEQ